MISGPLRESPENLVVGDCFHSWDFSEFDVEIVDCGLPEADWSRRCTTRARTGAQWTWLDEAAEAIVELEVTTTVDRPVWVLWEFYAVHHVENHPRWDPAIHLEKTSDGPIGLGTVIARRNTRYGTPTVGTMEIVEFEPER